MLGFVFGYVVVVKFRAQSAERSLKWVILRSFLYVKNVYFCKL